MKNILIAAVIGLLAHQSAISDPQITGTPAELRGCLASLPGQVTIAGSAERMVEASHAVLQLSIVTSERQLQVALDSNARIRAEILAKLGKGGIPASRVHTSRLGATPVVSSYSGKVKEYNVAGSIRIQAETEQEILLVASLVDTLTAVSLSSLTFEVANEEEITTELVKEALQHAEERRKLYETSLGVRLVPRAIGTPAPKVADNRAGLPLWASGDAVMSGSVAPNMYASGITLHALSQRDIDVKEFEELVYKANIVVTYDLLPQ